LLFSVLGDHYGSSVSWENVHIFWADERCVPPEDSESNYGMAKAVFLDRIKIPAHNVHRIRGENDPDTELPGMRADLKKSLIPRKDSPFSTLSCWVWERMVM
jgi:6-phosphogluconolactonase